MGVVQGAVSGHPDPISTLKTQRRGSRALRRNERTASVESTSRLQEVWPSVADVPSGAAFAGALATATFRHCRNMGDFDAQKARFQRRFELDDFREDERGSWQTKRSDGCRGSR